MLRFVKIKNNKDVVSFVIMTAAISIVFSVILTVISLSIANPEALIYPSTYFVSVLVPLIVAPIVATTTARLVLQLEQTKNQLEVINQIDSLTNIYNRRFFWERTQQELELAQKQDYPVALILFDIDNFKTFNDTYGHMLGDEILKLCASTAANSIRKSDYIARYGGEEFVVFLKDCNAENAKRTAERIRKNICAIEFTHENKPLSISVSLGVVSPQKSPLVLENLSQVADEAMYKAKHEGKNRFIWMAA